MEKELILILGGVRSGKSDYAQHYAQKKANSVVFIATAEAGDDEMAARIAMHKLKRPSHWKTIEAADTIGKVLVSLSCDVEVVIIDCLTMLISNIMGEENGEKVQEEHRKRIHKEIEDILCAYEKGSTTLIIVSNEVGMGIVSPTPMGRFFRDELGTANRLIAEKADRVLLMVAGLPVDVKGLMFNPHQSSRL
jgi:adenosylcobinamide kinase/adenosylcobinamide-phosphate guanylyltransferase